MKTTDAARGKWKQILVQFGIDANALTGRHGPCPCNGDGKDRFRFSDKNGSGSYFCACSNGEKDGFGLLACKTGQTFRELAKEVDAIIGNAHDAKPREATYAERLRAVAKPATRSKYLESRGLEVPPGLLFAQSVEYRDDAGTVTHKLPAILAPITRNGEFQTFHVTYLANGAKADVSTPRKVLPGGAIAGGGVELYPAAEEMGVGEGIETCIAAKMLFDCPTHAALNATMLAKWQPPAVAKVVWIFADKDRNYAGEAGAYQLAHRLAMQGIEARIVMPEMYGDFNDVLIAKQRSAA
jgi:putative DNA primase/helicase